MKRTHTTAVGVFEDRQHAQQAVNELRRAGFREDQIGVAVRDGQSVEGAKDVHGKGSKAAVGAATGVAAGAGIGALWGIGIIAGLLPAIGPAIAGGTLATILSSAAAGAAAAGLAGALIGLGIPEEEAKYYESEFQSGRTIVTVRAEDRYDEAVRILQRYHGHDYAGRAGVTASGQAACATTGAAATRSVQAQEEVLHPRKETVDKGEVRVRKEVHTEKKTLQVPVTREEVVIERHPASGRPASASDIKAGEEIRIPVREEEVHVEKQPVVKEEVVVGKKQVKDTKQVSGTVRKEEIKVETTGKVDVKDKKC